MARRDTPEINAGSMADIAFLLLIFFLVTTTMDIDAGISRRIPEKSDVEPPIIKMKNIFEITVNKNGALLIENEYKEIEDVKDLAIAFIDNGGGLGNPMPNQTDQKECDWCKGEKNPESSDHPNKAVILLKSDRSTKIGDFINVQNELGRAYTTLRNRLATDMYGESFTDMVQKLSKNKGNETLKERIKTIKSMYPEIISEQEI